MSTVDGRWHYVRHNATTRLPRTHIILDTEARSVRSRGGYEQSWRVGVAIYWHAPKGRPPVERTEVYRDASALWTDVTAYVPRRGRCVLWVHNLGYDVRTSRALEILPALGWRLIAHSLTPGATWLSWRRGDQTLVMVDSVSVFQTSIAQLAKTFMSAKLPLPSEGDSEAAWVARCLRDAEILRDAVVAYLDRLQEMDLGNWQLTGTGQAWAAFRHRWLTHDMLVHWDEDARSAERRAMWTGRCEAYWHGRAHHVRIDEWDMTLAYPRIALTDTVPVALGPALVSIEDMWRYVDRPGYATLAEVEVSTDVPLVPTDRDGRICWPVGTFRTTLWDPELRLLRDRGAGVVLVRGWAYRAEPALAEWAEWIVDQLAAPEGLSPPWWKTIMKHWARALIGRLAMTYRQWEHVTRLPYVDIRRWSYVDRETGQTGEAIQIGRDVFLATDVTEWPHSMPMITGWIQSRCREILTRLIIEAGERRVLYVDTDSMLVSGEHESALALLAAQHPEAGLRLKRSWESVEIMGPRQIITGPRVRVSGVPVHATRLADGSLAGEVWQSLAASLTARRATTVRITPRRWHLRAVDTRREAGPDGWTVPVRMVG